LIFPSYNYLPLEIILAGTYRLFEATFYFWCEFWVCWSIREYVLEANKGLVVLLIPVSFELYLGSYQLPLPIYHDDHFVAINVENGVERLARVDYILNADSIV